MNKSSIALCWLFSLAFLSASASATDLTAVTLFGCDDQGTVDPAFRYNSGPVDAAWDVFVYQGEGFDPASGRPDEIRWLNDAGDHTVRIRAFDQYDYSWQNFTLTIPGGEEEEPEAPTPSTGVSSSLNMAWGLLVVVPIIILVATIFRSSFKRGQKGGLQ